MSAERVDPYERVAEMALSAAPQERIVAAIWADVTDRRGWRQAADQFDNETKHEILDTWLRIVTAAGDRS